MEKINF